MKFALRVLQEHVRRASIGSPLVSVVSVYLPAPDGTWCDRLSVVTEGATTPWSWVRLPGIWSSWDHGDDWAAFDVTAGRQVVRRSTEQGGRPWFISECRSEALPWHLVFGRKTPK